MAARGTYRSFTIFLSSPSDVSPERERAKQIIESVNQTVRDLLHVNFHVSFWEGLPPETPSPDEGTIQDQLNKLVERSHIFLLILFKRYGTVETGHLKSNTERELDTILEKHKSNPKIGILSYFKKIDENVDPGDQELKVKALRSRLQKDGIFFKEFSNYEDFTQKFTHDLFSLAMKLSLSPYKSECLSHFWNITSGSGAAGVDLAIIYRPLYISDIEIDKRRPYWHGRLMPPVSFEDTKAIQKVQKNLKLLGLRSKVFRSAETPPNIALLNRLWVCAPRVPKSEEFLRRYGDRVRFKFFKRKDKDAILQWTNESGDLLKIKSPLARYLKIQRRETDSVGEWNAKLASIVAKDYGVVARFSGNKDDPSSDYVIAGVRGLGTWGGAWFLDRKYKDLRTTRAEGDFQILLEVMYRDGMIAEVKNVSGCPASYFQAEFSEKRIKEIIQDAIHGGPIR